MKKDTTTDTNIDNMVQLVSKDEVVKEFGEAVASMAVTDQVISWAKFVLTDDKPNGNGQRVPAEEFDNIIKSGLFKPIKMALGSIKDDHSDARPLGVITNLVKEGNKIIALAALWNHERTQDVATIKDMVETGKPVNVSWEILYDDSKVSNGITDLLGTILKAVTIVGIPAYAGRTQLLAVAAKKWSPAYISQLPDTSFLHISKDGTRYFAYRDETGKIDPSRFQPILEEIANSQLSQAAQEYISNQVNKIDTMVSADASLLGTLEVGDGFKSEDYELDTKEIEGKISELEAKLALANDLVATKEKELAEVKTSFEATETKVKDLEVELQPLRDFKLEADKAIERQTKLSEIKDKFISVGLTKADEYFSENADKLLSLDPNGLEFMLQEMVAFKSEDKGTSEASLKTSGIPNIQSKSNDLSDVKDLAAALRERNKK